MWMHLSLEDQFLGKLKLSSREMTRERWRELAWAIYETAKAHIARKYGREQLLRDLLSEVDCRIEHGADSGGHLEHVREKLRVICENAKSDSTSEDAREQDHFEGNIGANIAGGYCPSPSGPYAETLAATVRATMHELVYLPEPRGMRETRDVLGRFDAALSRLVALAEQRERKREREDAVADVALTILTLRSCDEVGEPVPSRLRARIRVMEDEWFNRPTPEGKERRSLLALLARHRQALAFYADRNNWAPGPRLRAVDADEGAQARDALAASAPGTEEPSDKQDENMATLLRCRGWTVTPPAKPEELEPHFDELEMRVCWAGPTYSHPPHVWKDDRAGGQWFACRGASTDRT